MHVCEDCGHTTDEPKIHYLHLKDNHPYLSMKKDAAEEIVSKKEGTGTTDQEGSGRAGTWGPSQALGALKVLPGTSRDDLFPPKHSGKTSNKIECEICGFVGSTTNQYREKLDHLANSHFKERLEAVIPKTRPYACPALDCSIMGKDRQDVLRHYTGKHNTIKMWVDEYICKQGSLPNEMMEEVEPESLNENGIFEKVSNETMKEGEQNNLNEKKRVSNEIMKEVEHYVSNENKIVAKEPNEIMKEVEHDILNENGIDEKVPNETMEEVEHDILDEHKIVERMLTKMMEEVEHDFSNKNYVVKKVNRNEEVITNMKCQRKRCSGCEGCRRKNDCRKCKECSDKKVNGGPGLLKKSCRFKKCKLTKNRWSKFYTLDSSSVRDPSDMPSVPVTSPIPGPTIEPFRSTGPAKSADSGPSKELAPFLALRKKLANSYSSADIKPEELEVDPLLVTASFPSDATKTSPGENERLHKPTPPKLAVELIEASPTLSQQPSSASLIKLVPDPSDMSNLPATLTDQGIIDWLQKGSNTLFEAN